MKAAVKSKTKMLLSRDERRRIQKEKQLKSRAFRKTKRTLFALLLIVFAVSYFTRNNHRSVSYPLPDLFEEPEQIEITNPELIEFDKDGYHYELTPLYEYEINSLVVNRFDYTWFSIRRTDSAFPIDLCVIWGDNVESEVYQSRSLYFTQDGRFCNFSWTRKLDFDTSQISNNHLVISDESIERKALDIHEGDQVRIKGKLVNIKATSIDGDLDKYEFESGQWTSSVTREDSGAGACEVIYVEELEILKRGNLLSYWAFNISKLLLIIFIAWGLLKFFQGVIRGK